MCGVTGVSCMLSQLHDNDVTRALWRLNSVATRLFCWTMCIFYFVHDDVINWKHFPRYWPFVRGIHRPPVNSPHKGQWRGALMFSLIGVRINGSVNKREAGDLRRYHAHYDVIIMFLSGPPQQVACGMHHSVILTASGQVIIYTCIYQHHHHLPQHHHLQWPMSPSGHCWD